MNNDDKYIRIDIFEYSSSEGDNGKQKWKEFKPGEQSLLTKEVDGEARKFVIAKCKTENMA